MKKCFLSSVILLTAFSLSAQRNLKVDVTQIVAPVSPTMWGIFFEDINFGADGGLYAEMVKNRSFEFPMPLTGWKEVRNNASGRILIENTGNDTAANTRYARLTIDAPSGTYGIANEGFRGMGFQKGASYNLHIQARANSGHVALKVEAVNASGRVIGSAVVTEIGKDWKNYKVSFTTNDTAQKGKLQIVFSGKGTADVDYISLFPQNTWKNRPNGLRADLVQYLADMKPGFVRFPGGCIVEGRDLTNRYQWKATVGAPEDRKTMVNRWNMEFRHRPAPDYYQSFGLGFYEYFLLSEDVGAEPLPILNCGMACQFNSSEVASMESIDPYIQDALDLIEFANGDLTTRWGKLRADMGHPQPFNLKYLGIGNEQWDVQYIERYKEFQKVLREKYPQVKLVSAAGASPEGKMFDYAWKELKAINADIVDEHYYQTPSWFLKHADRYDGYDRKGPKVFAGEYAAQSRGIASTENRNNWDCALSEAAFMTGLERNADLVTMASYAPLFAHVDAWQWTPDLIWFDNLRSYGTPNYYVQQLFSLHKGTDLLRLTEEGAPVKGKDSLYASSVLDKKSGELIIKLVNASAQPIDVATTVAGAKLKGEGRAWVLTSSDKQSVNTLDQPQLVAPAVQKIPVKGKITLQAKPYSMTVVRIPVVVKK